MFDVETEKNILVVGAGPSGLALAAELKRRGVNTVIIDQHPAGANTSRACVVHARTMEVLEPLGVTRDLLAEGVQVPVFRIRDRDRPLLTIDFSDIPSFYRFTLMHGVRDFISITASQKLPAEVEFYCAETPHTFTLPPADKA